MTRPDRGWPRLKRVFMLPFTRTRIDAALREEFRFHIQERVDQFVAAGMPRPEAEAEVARRFGNYEAYRKLAMRIDEETMRQRTFSETMDTLRREMRLAARVLLRTPAFSLIAFITLALGIGATTAIFTVLDAVVLRPLPYPAAGELVSILHPATVPGNGERKWGLSFGGYIDFLQNAKSFIGVGIYVTTSTIVSGGSNAEVARVGNVTPSVFAVLRARPALGRLFDATDALPDSLHRVVLSYEFWQRRFGGDRAIVGKTLQTDGSSYDIIGVSEPGLTLPMPGPFASTANLAGFGVDVWTSLKVHPDGPFYNQSSLRRRRAAQTRGHGRQMPIARSPTLTKRLPTSCRRCIRRGS